MGFEQNKKALLKNLSKVKREKTLERKSKAYSRDKTQELREMSLENKHEKKTIILFGVENFFIRSITNSLKLSYTIKHFDDPGKACDYCIDFSVNYVFLDMDIPTDWKQSTDVFTTVKTINPEIKCYLFSADPTERSVQTLEAQGAVVLKKPVSLEDIKAYLSY